MNRRDRARDPRRPVPPAARTKGEAEPRRPTTRRSTRFRVALAIVVSAGFLFVFVFPTSAWWDQRQEIRETERRVELLRAEADALERERDRLGSDDVIERLARERFNLVRPGETAWAVVPRPDGGPAASEDPGPPRREPVPTDPVPTDPVPTDPVPTDPVPTDPTPVAPHQEPAAP